MDLVKTQYIQINLIGIVMLLIMLFYILGVYNTSERSDQKFFAKLLICNVIILLSDILIYLMRWHSSGILILANNLVCIIYFIMHSYFGYLWLRYSIKKLYPEYEPTRNIQVLFMIPLIVSSIIIVTSPWTKWVYYLTSENRYMRGDYLGLVIILSYLYWIASAILTISEIIQQKRIREQEIYITLLVFPFPTLIGNILQLKFYGLSIVWVCSAISLLILFINFQNYQLSHDILTGLFNRRQTNKYLMREINLLHHTNYLLFLIMVDVDKFKIINDQFGHLVGDQALIDVSNILRKSCREKDFIGRFGGDEFIIIGRSKNEEEINSLICNINRMVTVHNNENASPYNLALSTGYELYKEKAALTLDSIISAADNEMYKTKNSKH